MSKKTKQFEDLVADLTDLKDWEFKEADVFDAIVNSAERKNASAKRWTGKSASSHSQRKLKAHQHSEA